MLARFQFRQAVRYTAQGSRKRQLGYNLSRGFIAVVEPAIPRELRNQVINATVRLSFTVQADGTVAAPSVISDSNRRLNKSAIEAIAQWRFEPIRNERVTEIEFHFIQE